MSKKPCGKPRVPIERRTSGRGGGHVLQIHQLLPRATFPLAPVISLLIFSVAPTLLRVFPFHPPPGASWRPLFSPFPQGTRSKLIVPLPPSSLPLSLPPSFPPS